MTVPLEDHVPRILVAGVGNLLRGDDGFGPVVAERLGDLEGARVIDTGIGGIALLQELMAGWEGLVVIDAVDQGVAPGTVLVLDPVVADAVHVPDVHLANPDRVLSLAAALGVLPARVRLVGCQPMDTDRYGPGLSPAVERAVVAAVREVRQIVDSWLTGP